MWFLCASALRAVCGVAVPAALLRAQERREDGQRRSLLQVCLLKGFSPKKLVLKVLKVVKLGRAVEEIKYLSLYPMMDAMPFHPTHEIITEVQKWEGCFLSSYISAKSGI